MWLLMHSGIKVIRVSKGGPRLDYENMAENEFKTIQCLKEFILILTELLNFIFCGILLLKIHH